MLHFIFSDIDGLSNQDIGGQMLHDAHSHNQRLLSLVTKSTTKTGEAGKRNKKQSKAL